MASSPSAAARPPRSPAARRRAPTRAESIRVRAAGARDVPAIAAMRLALVAEETGRDVLPARAASRARRLTADQIASEREVILLAVADGAIVGMVRCVETRGSPLLPDTRCAGLTSAYVRPAYRRRGVLRALLRAADAWCRARKLGEIRLQCALQNAGGTAAWTALGFTPCDVRYRRTVPDR